MKERPNIFLITIDCLRADFVGCIGKFKDITPNLDRLAREGIIFTKAFSNGPYTRGSFPSILTSTYSTMNPDPLRMSKYNTSIAEVLREYGFKTAGYNTNAYLSRYFSYNKGFDYFFDILSKNNVNFSTFIRTVRKKITQKIKKTKFNKLLNYFPLEYSKDKDVEIINNNVMSLLKLRKTGNFIWMHYMNAHIPYYPPRKYRKISKNKMIKINEVVSKNPSVVSKRTINQVINLYKGTIKHIDYEFSKFLNKLKQYNIYDNSLFIVTSDHGDEFKEHGYFSHPPQLYDELIHVPLIISGPKLPKNLKVNNLVSTLDIPPTILDYLGFEENKDFQGKSLLPLILGKKDYIHHEGIISEIIPIPDSKLISFRTDKWKLILDKEKETKELFNLVNDPNELVNVFNQYPSIVEFLTLKIQEYNKMKHNMLNKAKEMKKVNDILANIKDRI